MGKKLLLILLGLSAGLQLLRGASISEDASLQRLYEMAGRNYNYSSQVPEKEILDLCQKMEALALKQKDYENLFLIQQITVNSYCLKGDIGLAVNKAQQMYEEAKKLNFNVGIALSLQAIGGTYMHSDQYKQALATFEEAYKLIEKTNYSFIKIRLLLQKVHVCMLLENANEMQYYLTEASKQLDRADIQNKEDYAFYTLCYQTLYYITMGNSDNARTSLESVRQTKADSSIFSRWYYFLNCRYHELAREYDSALLYCDSTLQIVKGSSNLNEYRQLMLIKASLLTKNGNKQEACQEYVQARHLSDSLNMVRYSMQIDSLHVTYWVDQMELENAMIHNRYLKWSIACGVAVLLIAVMLFLLARKRNRKLIESRKRLELVRQETSESIRSKSLFLSNMSHELRTPLNAIVGFADLLSLEEIDDSEMKIQFGDRIKQNAELLVKLFSDVADLSALNDRNIKFVFGDYDVVALCRNVVDTVDNVKRTAANIGFTTSLDSLTLHTDSGRLQQVLINLLVNATKFTTEGSITLTLEKDEALNMAVFAIEDTGCGIPLEKQPHIFERFEKLHEGVQGAGLGLSICQLIVKHVGGEIWIDSAYTKGARFVFTHPLSCTNK